MEDKIALQRVYENDPGGFKYLFDKYYPGLCEFSCLYVKSADVASDLVTEFFIRFWKQRHQIQIHSSLRAFIYKSVKNASLNHLRGKKRETLNYEDYTEVIVSTELSPQEQIEFKEFQDDLEAFTQSLPDRRKLILTLKLESGLTNQEIAHTLLIAESTVKNQLREAMETFRARTKIRS